MPLILTIDTATEIATVCISEKNQVIDSISNEDQKQHASFLQDGIKNLLQKCGISQRDLSAVSVTAGPGSYTGLRVGIASAKGFSYALNIPLILLNTLEVMANAVMISDKSITDNVLFCPMIDARRMDIFTAVYDSVMKEIVQPCVMKIEEDTFSKLLDKYLIIFSGSGAAKASPVIKHPNAKFIKSEISYANALGNLSFEKFKSKSFCDVAVADALYMKEFFTIL